VSSQEIVLADDSADRWVAIERAVAPMAIVVVQPAAEGGGAVGGRGIGGDVTPISRSRVWMKPPALKRKRAALKGVTWHALRHAFASRLVAAGVDLRTVQELGGRRTLSMVQRYAHLSPGHLAVAIEKIVAQPAPGVPGAVALGLNLDSARRPVQV